MGGGPPHPARGRLRLAAPTGDVAVYGLDRARGLADHVAVVIDLRPGRRGPDVVNGDGDRSAFSVVEVGRDDYDADTAGRPSTLAGYVSPVAP